VSKFKQILNNHKNAPKALAYILIKEKPKRITKKSTQSTLLQNKVFARKDRYDKKETIKI